MYITNKKNYSPDSYPPTKIIESSSENNTSSKCINNAQVVWNINLNFYILMVFVKKSVA